jgi:hypothetical protein
LAPLHLTALRVTAVPLIALDLAAAVLALLGPAIFLPCHERAVQAGRDRRRALGAVDEPILRRCQHPAQGDRAPRTGRGGAWTMRWVAGAVSGRRLQGAGQPLAFKVPEADIARLESGVARSSCLLAVAA